MKVRFNVEIDVDMEPYEDLTGDELKNEMINDFSIGALDWQDIDVNVEFIDQIDDKNLPLSFNNDDDSDQED